MSREIDPHNDVVEVTSFAADIDLIATYGEMCRNIEVMDTTAGTTLEVITGKGFTRPLTVADDQIVGPLWVSTITSNTDVTRLRVYF